MEKTTGNDTPLRRGRLLTTLRAAITRRRGDGVRGADDGSRRCSGACGAAARALVATALVLLAGQMTGQPTAEADNTTTLSVRTNAAYVFTDVPCLFSLDVPHVPPSEARVVTDDARFSDTGIRLLSAKKMELVESASAVDGGTVVAGTRFEFLLSFAASGTIIPPPLTLTVANRSYHIPFAPVIVSENPESLEPELGVVFMSGIDRSSTRTVAAGTNVTFAVTVRHCTSIERLSWQLPKDAICSELSRTAFADGTVTDEHFTPQARELAVFSWTPLVEGSFRLPELQVVAVAYNGSRHTLTLTTPPITVTAPSPLEVDSANERSQGEALFAAAFAPPDDDETPFAESTPAPDCALLAELRSRERHSLPWSVARRERAAYEIAHGIACENEPSVWLLWLAATLVVALVTVALLSAARGRRRNAVAFAVGTALVLALSVPIAVSFATPHAVFMGGTVRVIPETEASFYTERAGICVRVLEKVGDWVYIATADASGWVSQTALVPIR